MRTAPSLVASTLVFALLLTACGGGGGDAPTLFLSAPNVPGMSGFIHGPGTGPVVNSSIGSAVWVGDHPSDSQEYGFYRFNIAAIPAGSEIVEAVFRVGQTGTVNSPYLLLGGQVIIDHVELGAALDPADYVPTVYAPNVAILSTTSAVGQKSANVTAAVRADVQAGRPRTDLRLRFPMGTNNDGFYNDVAFNNMADIGGTGLLPLLEIRYRTP